MNPAALPTEGAKMTAKTNAKLDETDLRILHRMGLGGPPSRGEKSRTRFERLADLGLLGRNGPRYFLTELGARRVTDWS